MTPEQIRDEVVDRAAKLDPEYADLVHLYYRYLPPEEVVEDDPAELVGAVRSNFLLARQRIVGRPAVRVLNPTLREDGWDCSTTVVQVVTDDMPYLVDSVVAELTRGGVGVQRVVHPIVVVRRSISGELREVLATADPENPPADGNVESWMSIEVDLITDPARARELETNLTAVLHDVREVFEDTDKMVTQAQTLADRLEAEPPATLPAQEVAEGARLLRWLADHHFTFLGYRQYELFDDPAAGGAPALRATLATGLGVLRQDSLAARSLTAGPDIAAHAQARELLVLTEASAPSTVHRSAYPYFVGVKTFDEHGDVNGEHRFLGVLTSAALYEDVLDIPVIERRVREVIHRAGFPMDSYSGQKMLDVIQNYPRPELLSTDVDSLYETTTGVLALADRRRLRLFMRRDPYNRFFSCLVYLPRDRYTTTTRLAMQEALLAELGGTDLEYSARVGETEVARVHFIVHTDPAAAVEADQTLLQQRLADAIRSWGDLMVDAVLAEGHELRHVGGHPFSSETAAELGQRYAAAFPEAYKEDFSAAQGLTDLRRLQALPADGGLETSFYLPEHPEPGERRFKLYLAGARVTLSQVLPVLQRMGVEVVDERPYEVRRDDGVQCWIFDFGLRIDPKVLDALSGELDRSRVRFQEAFAAAWRGECEVDGFNSLVLRAGLDWRQAAVLRAYAKYLRQAGTPYSQDYIEDAVLGHTEIAKALVTLFETRFNPAIAPADRVAHAEHLTGEITGLIDEVVSLDSDRILRSFLGLIDATLRTNFYVRDGDAAKPYLAVKLDSAKVPDLPAPRPRFEIFVYSPRFEGVHLRFGPVARGGLRWSDRREDFRTEVLGLVKAQAVKNAVIVPVGAKGGFVLKRPPVPTGDPGLDREALQAEGIACYRAFICGLLDLTDNLDAGTVVPARGVVRYDSDDTYLVVAADKGTATFSDIANEVAQSYGFWLGDAFASGGSAGYDHKALGITAKGAWEAVKRHFRELDLDTQSQDFTVVGVGDMSGDVFGNGMLLSEHIRLVAAFDHRHIFIDPEPDAAAGFAERTRLFHLPRSSWDDYDRSLISEGGGVWPRTAKSIPVSPAVGKALGLPDTVTKLSPAELMHAILLAPVDLLWNGGIGTYVKATGESHGEVGDKANDAIRVNGGELRVRVVGEGGNLGLTQRGRIEFARAGGKVNTDALDNSAGVDMSDHEVNIKILLDHLVTDGRLDHEQRNELLAEMADQVTHLVLADNYDQNQVLGVSRAHAVGMLNVHARLVADLEQRSGLDRALEALPTSTEFRALDKARQGLTSPELATLLAHVKLALKDEVLASDLPDLDVFARRLPEYFPSQLRERFQARIAAHPLRREITTTMLVNEVVDGGGVSFAFRLAEEMSASATDAVRAFVASTRIFDLPSLWQEIRALDNVVPSGVADSMMLESRRLLDRGSRWLLNNRPQPLAVGAELSRFSAPVRQLSGSLLELLRGKEREHVVEETQRLVGMGVPEHTAGRVASLLDTFCLLDVIEIAELAEREGVTPGVERSHMETAQLYYALSEHLDMDRMLSSVSALERGNRWHSLARLALRDDLYSSIRAITVDVLRRSDPGDTADEKIERWEQSNASRLERARSALDEIRRANRLDLPTLSVAARQVRSMVR